MPLISLLSPGCGASFEIQTPLRRGQSAVKSGQREFALAPVKRGLSRLKGQARSALLGDGQGA